MTWVKDLATPYHQQDTDYYCGAAVGQMILDAIGVGVLDQDTLYASNHGHSSAGWYSSPEGLRYTLTDLAPPGFNGVFAVESAQTEPESSANIARSLCAHSVAVASLVYDCGHWVAVRGVKTDVAPAPGVNYAIRGFFINNPWPPAPSFKDPALAPPPPHADPDTCGSGGHFGKADEYVPHREWHKTFHTGCDVYGDGHTWFVNVCDPRRPPFGTLRLAGREKLAAGDLMIEARMALDLADRGIAEHDLATDGPLAEALKDAKASEAQLVQRLDRPDDFYYLVTMRRDSTATALLRLDALDGDFQGAQALADSPDPVIIDPKAALEAARKAVVDLEDGKGRIRLREGAYSVYPNLVWRPCRESRSPYYPFHQINVGASSIYVGHDGRVYSALHDLGRG